MTYQLSSSFCSRFNTRKPPLPYFSEEQFTVRSHSPPAPTRQRCSLKPDTAYERENKDPLDRCLLHPSLPGSNEQQVVRLRISEAIRVGDGQNSQSGAVQILNVKPLTAQDPSQNAILVAKFYDPLYFDHEQDDANPFLCVDRDYSHEAATYTTLSKLQGTVVPRYYDSFTLELPVYGVKRLVRLILIKLVSEASMKNLDPTLFSKLKRQIIMKAVVDAESLLYTNNVRHREINPRNVIVSTNERSIQRVSFIDFEKSLVGRSPFPEDAEEEMRYFPDTPITPLLRGDEKWWPYLQYSFGA